MRKHLQNIFKLPPVEERYEKSGVFGKKFWFKNNAFAYKHNYTYLCYLVWRTAALSSATLGLFVLLFTVYIVEIKGVNPQSFRDWGYDPLGTEMGVVGLYAYWHAMVMKPILLSLVFLTFLLFLIHVPKGSEDVFQKDNVLKHKSNRTFKKKFWRFMLFAFVLLLGYLGISQSYITLSLFRRWIPESLGLDSSLLFLIIYYCYSVTAHCFGAVMFYGPIFMNYALLANYCVKDDMN